MPAPKFFREEGILYCEADGRLHVVIDAGGQRWFVSANAWDSSFRKQIVEALTEVGTLFADMLSAGVPLDDARRILPAGAMMNLEFEAAFGEGEQL